MNHWIVLLGAALAAAPAPLCAQTGAAITITGQLAGALDSATVAVFEPQPGLPLNYFFTEGFNEAVVRGGRFSYQLHHGQAGFVHLQNKDAPQELVFVEPGARIGLTTAPTVANVVPPAQFTGTNAAANNLMASRQLLNGGPADGQRFATVLATAPTAAGVLQALQNELKKPNGQLLTAFQRREISPLCYEALTAETEQRLLFWAGSALMGHFTDSAKADLHLKMPRAEARKLVADLFARYAPTLPRYRYTTLSNSSLLARFRQKGVLPGPPPVARTWGRYEKQFAPVASNLAQYDYLPAAAQSNEVGSLLLTALAFNAMSTPEFAAVFADYRRLFPASAYVPVVAKALKAAQTAPTQPTTVAGQNITLGRFETGGRTLTFAPAPGLDTVTTLADLVRQQFRGRPVFLDFWASWCGPCIAEFRHEPALHEFLTQKGIDVLYVSVDQPGFREKWAALAVKNNLRGYHYLASPAVQESLKPVVPYIPRYMLFDGNGVLVEASAHHPSDGEKLYRQLQARLRGK